MEIRTIQQRLKEGLELSVYEPVEAKYVTKPIGQALYNKSYEEKKEEKKERKKGPYNKYERIKCELCGKVISKTNKSTHRKSKYHQAHERMNKKLREILLE